MDDKVLKAVYTIFLGVILALFVGLGVRTFYPPPEVPEFPIELSVPTTTAPTDEELAEQQEAQREYEIANRAWMDENEAYNRNVTTVSLAASVVMLGLSLLLEKRNRVLANGVMLGSLFTLIYSIFRGFLSGDTTLTFITVTIGLAIVLFLGYRRFFQPRAQAPVEASG